MELYLPQNMMDSNGYLDQTVLKDIKRKVDLDLINNPIFNSTLEGTCAEFLRRGSKTKIEISENKKRISFIGEKQIFENGELKGKITNKTDIIVDPENNIKVFTFMGNLQKKDEFIKDQVGTQFEELAEEMKNDGSKSAINGVYRYRAFDDDGIFLEAGFYHDAFPLNTSVEETNVLDELYSQERRPIFRGGIPIFPNEVHSANFEVTSTSYDNLAIIKKVDGNASPKNRTMNEKWYDDKQNLLMENGKLVGQYSNQTFQQINEDTLARFYAELDPNRYDPQTYAAIRKRCKNSPYRGFLYQ